MMGFYLLNDALKPVYKSDQWGKKYNGLNVWVRFDSSDWHKM